MKKFILLSTLLISCVIFGQETITYPSQDALSITADLYNGGSNDTFILLFHQAGWSRGEYQEIAPKLNKLGYSCLAVDQRSGGAVNDVKNNTSAAAKEKGKKTKYIDAFPDIEASVAYIKKAYNPKKIVIWGSSYSSSLVLKYAGDNPNAIQGVLSFSPGEYFGSKDFITQSAKNIKVPVFITSAKNEKKNWIDIYEAINTTNKQFFLPEGGSGNHGSRALWAKHSEHKEYWTAVKGFLKTL